MAANYRSSRSPTSSRVSLGADVSVGDDVYLIAWSDNDRNAFVDPGDAFNVTFFSGVRSDN